MASDVSCLLRNRDKVQELASAVGLDPTVASAKIGTWMKYNKTEVLPELE